LLKFNITCNHYFILISQGILSDLMKFTSWQKSTILRPLNALTMLRPQAMIYC
jgi:hypothetical protein